MLYLPRRVCVCLSVLGLAVTVAAQSTIVAGAAPSGLARTMNNNDSSLAMGADGTM